MNIFNIDAELLYLVFLSWIVAFRVSKEPLTWQNIFMYGIFAIIGVMLIGRAICDYFFMEASSCQTTKFVTAISTKGICEFIIEVIDRLKENANLIIEKIVKKWLK